MKIAMILLTSLLFCALSHNASAQTFLGQPVIVKTSVNTPEGETIPFVQGRMVDGFTKKVIEAYMDNPNGKIALQSTGGVMSEAYKLGNFIQDNKLKVYVVDYCISSCAFAAMSAERVFFSDESFIAFHAPYFEEIDPRFSLEHYLKTISLATFKLGMYFEETGFKQQFLFDILDKTSRDVYIVYTSNEELNAERIGSPDRIRLFSTREQIKNRQQER